MRTERIAFIGIAATAIVLVAVLAATGTIGGNSDSTTRVLGARFTRTGRTYTELSDNEFSLSYRAKGSTEISSERITRAPDHLRFFIYADLPGVSKGVATPTLRATLKNTGSETLVFADGLRVVAQLGHRSVTLSDPSVRDLAPGQTASVTADVSDLAYGVYGLSGSVSYALQQG